MCYGASFGAAACYYRLFLFTTVFFFLMRLMLYLVWRRSAFCQRASCSYHYGERYCISSSLQPLFLFFFFCKHACLPFVLTLDKCCGTHYII